MFEVKTAMLHSVVGVCPQHDLLWADLTAYEHMLFYCRLRGVTKTVEHDAATKALNSVRLLYAKDTLAQNLSGGERRRLSIGIALAGQTKVIFLDEPTTGVDPEARRQIWSIIQAIRSEKTVILTTHSMDEAEMLCSEIGIMARGRFRCVGPLEQLRKVFSSGYQVALQFYPDDSTHVIRSVDDVLHGKAERVALNSDSVVYKLRDGVRISPIYAALEAIPLIRDFTISEISLENIFIEATRNA